MKIALLLEICAALLQSLYVVSLEQFNCSFVWPHGLSPFLEAAILDADHQSQCMDLVSNHSGSAFLSLKAILLLLFVFN